LSQECKKGIVAADRGELIEHDEVKASTGSLSVVMRSRWTCRASDQFIGIVQRIKRGIHESHIK
jgi:hypothetical protein